MVVASGTRIGWRDLPGSVRHAVEEILGAPVTDAVSQAGGFSPGTADRVRTADGGRAFVKAVGAVLNEHSPRLHRQEAVVTAALPLAAPTPKLLGVHDDGDWVALVLTDVDGRHPSWDDPAHVTAVRATLADLARVLTPCPIPDAPATRDLLAPDFAGWHRLRDDPPAELDPWVAGHLGDLCRRADHGLAALAGDTLTHTDLRADNLLIGDDGTVTVVDWPWGARGPRWLDTLLLLLNIRLYGGDPDLATVDADRADLVGVLAGFGGFFVDAARHLAPPGPAVTACVPAGPGGRRGVVAARTQRLTCSMSPVGV
ncbi:phosphotransferase [Actinophytocola glycyrrhizae]|uniref:Phosphotransferase n=1 Tax=Actinophytocola glycyrrhizae TaxID=2044873 RepID=A0ABV9SF21_9PSEU